VAAARPFDAQARQVDRSRRVSALEEAKRTFEKISHPSEAERSDYITRLVRMREKAAGVKTDEWQTIDAEIKRHPAADDSDSKILSGRLVGKWASPRHDYLYRADGSWTMLSADEGTTHGSWHWQLDDASRRRGDNPWQLAN
jgi:hypothetical protein